jgi:hypothetical protein
MIGETLAWPAFSLFGVRPGLRVGEDVQPQPTATQHFRRRTTKFGSRSCRREFNLRITVLPDPSAAKRWFGIRGILQTKQQLEAINSSGSPTQAFASV